MKKTYAYAIFLGFSLLLTQSSVLSQSQAQYAEEKMAAWKRAEASMNAAYALLLKQADAEQNKAPAQELREAKEKWEEFRRLFCRSVSTTYGGMWQSTHESECRAKLAGEFEQSLKSYGW